MQRGFLILTTVFLFSCNKKEVIKPSYKSITEAVYASGTIYAKDEYKVFAQAEGTITAQLIEAGNEVGVGTLIYTIQSDATQARWQANDLSWQISSRNRESAAAPIAELQLKMESAKAQMENDARNFERFSNMYAANAISKLEYDKIATQYQVSKNNYKAMEESLERLNDQLLMEERNAYAQKAAAAQDLKNYNISSKIKGFLYETYKEPGESVKRNDVLALIGSKDKKYIQLLVDQQDIYKIKLGQEVVLKTDMTGEQVFKARVTKIYSTMNAADQSFKVEAEFEGDVDMPFIHTTVEANIVIKTKEKALVIPSSLINSQSEVIVKDGVKTKKIKVQTGLSNLEEAEIVSGINASDELLREE